MSALPSQEPELDTAPYEVIHLGQETAVVVPMPDFLRMRELERAVTFTAEEDAEDAEALQEWRTLQAAGQARTVPSDEVRHRLGLSAP